MNAPAVWLTLATLLAGCSGETSATNADAGNDVRIDPFCIGRPLLTFCEDFDDRALPGAFAEQLRTDGATIAIDADTSVPSSPRAASFQLSAGGTASAWLRTGKQAPSAQAAVFFYVRLDTLGADLELAALEDVSGHRVALAVARDGTLSLVSGSGTKEVHPSSIKLAAAVWTAVRFDVRFSEGALVARLRIGSATAFLSEPVGPAGTKIEPRFAIGASRADGPAVRVSFDSVTFEGPGSS